MVEFGHEPLSNRYRDPGPVARPQDGPADGIKFDVLPGASIMLHGRLHRRGYRIEELQRRLWAQRRTHGLAHLGNFVDQGDQLVSVRGPRLSSSYAVPRREERKRAEEDQLAPQHRELIVTDVDIHTCRHQPASEAQRSLKVLIVEIVSESELHQHERTRVFNTTGRGSSRGNPDGTRNHTRAVDVSQHVDMVVNAVTTGPGGRAGVTL